MASSGTVSLAAIWEMLDFCAPGYKAKARKHNWLVTYNGKAYPGLPRGEHGKRKSKQVEIQAGHVKKMARFLGILECAQGRIERLR